jgi:uncharacterized protein
MPKDCLIIFTRYPEAGKVKTRLIPALGAAAAADLHQRMVEHTLEKARALRQCKKLAIEVWFTGGNIAQMQDWLGTDVNYEPQPGGDLGDRLIAAFKTAFTKGQTSVVIVGTDCPDLNSTLLEKSFDVLQQHELVLGPAIDGGYYLVGLGRFVPELFEEIAWSTQAVLEQTLAITQQLDLEPVLLECLSDVDLPQDLENPTVQSLLDMDLGTSKE